MQKGYHSDVQVVFPGDDRTDKYPEKWAVVYDNGFIVHFDNEEDACAMQRAHRESIGLDPITGESSLSPDYHANTPFGFFHPDEDVN